MIFLGGWVREIFSEEVASRLRSKEEKELRIARAGRRTFPGTGNSMLKSSCIFQELKNQGSCGK